MSALALAMTAAWAAAAAMLAAYATLALREVTYVTLADGRRQERSLPLVFKLLLPFCGNFARMTARPAFAKQVAAADALLASAGFEGLLSGREFVALKILVPMTMGTLWSLFILVVASLLEGSIIDELKFILCGMGYVLMYAQPMMWLKGALRRRHLSIMRSLPFVLDLLTLSVEAGMDFISALQRNCSARKMDPLNEELLRMSKEIQVGRSRREALKSMADRVNQPDLRSVSYALIQADELGVSLGAILRIQSEQLRARRFDRAERLAAEAPTKMLFPLMFCIFPAVFIILLVPIISQTVKSIM